MDRTHRTTANVSRRTVIRGTAAGLFALGGTGTAAADGEDEDEGEEEPTASVDFRDQTVANNDDGDGPTVTVERLETNEGGYQSIHQYSRFQFAEGEDPEEYDVPVPDELDNPICESLIGITEYLEPGVHEDLEVPLFRSDSPAVELDAAEVGPLGESQVMIAIPHHNTTDEETFNCPDDPSTPNPFENGEEVDGAFQNGSQAVDDIGVSHDLATVLIEDDDEEGRGIAERQKELIEEGVLVPQPVGPDDEEEEDVEEENDEDDEENGDEEEQEDDENDENDENDEKDETKDGENEEDEGTDDENEEDEEEGDETEDEDDENEDEDDEKDDDRREKHGKGRKHGKHD